MEIVRIAAVGVVGALLALTLREEKKEFAVAVAILTGLLLTVEILRLVAPVVTFAQDLAGKLQGGAEYFKVLLKCIGVCYICHFAAELCTDSGESAMASRIELAGKATVMLLALPLLRDLAELSFGLMGL